jgi:cell wall-active antibiotic response 4TMS protein YvqF/B-box zinc finger protein
MNCANHPEVATAAYCQSCGKPLCTECIRSVGGVVYCEPCLAARLSTPGAAGAPTPDASLTNLHAHPVLAGLLGFIPGVGAMYNGQFVKALAHVLIFAVFVSLSDKSFIFGMLVAAWTFYQVFDAAQTAKARRDGLPLPNPFGLNDLGTRLGVTPAPPAAPFAAGFAANPAPGTPAGPAAAADPNSGFNPGANPGGTGPFPPPPSYTASYAAPPPPSGNPGPGSPVYPYPPAPEPHRHPLGAIVLIGIGLLLLLHTLGVFEEEWIGRAWPLIIIGIGAWLLYRRSHDVPRGGA